MDLEKKKIRKAVQALFALLEEDKKSKFIDEAEKVNLQFTFKKVPDVKNKSLHLKIPHSLQRSTQDVCLFVKDLNKKKRDFDPTVRHYKDLLETHNVNTVTEENAYKSPKEDVYSIDLKPLQVIPMKSLKTEYKPYEAKRMLSDRFDVFLADKCIVRLLPDYLGKNFYGRKRVPIGVNMKAKNLKKEIDQALDNSRCIISGRGSSCMATVAHSQMKPDSVVENVIASANQIAAGIPGGPINIKNMYIKSGVSMSIPIYFSADEGDVALPTKKRKADDTEPEEITTLIGGKVKVSPFGDVQVMIEKQTAEDEDLDLEQFTQRKKFKSSHSKPNKKTKKKAKGPISKTVHKEAVGRKGIKQPLKKKKTLKSKS